MRNKNGSPFSPTSLAYARLHLYTLSFIATFGLYLLTNGFVHSLLYWLVGGISTAFLLISLLRTTLTTRYLPGFLRMGVCLGTSLCLASPLLTSLLWDHQSLGTIVATQSIWPQLLLTLLASQILSEDNLIQTAAFLRHPLEVKTLFQAHSLLGTLFLGAFMTLCFYLILPHANLTVTDPAISMIISALNGKTVIHLLIIFLFFVLISILFESTLTYLQNQRTLGQIQQLIKTSPDHEQSPHHLVEHLSQELSHQPAAVPSLRFLSSLIENMAIPQVAPLALPTSQDALRLFLRRLIPLLPLLGFLGTVIGLATTMAQLPQGLASGGAHMADFTGALAGLAIKFETTLLGLLASLIATFLLNFLEKREQEWVAQCNVIAEYLTKAPQQHA